MTHIKNGKHANIEKNKKPPNKNRARGITQSPIWQTPYPIGLWIGKRRKERAVMAALRSS